MPKLYQILLEEEQVHNNTLEVDRKGDTRQKERVFTVRRNDSQPQAANERVGGVTKGDAVVVTDVFTNVDSPVLSYRNS